MVSLDFKMSVELTEKFLGVSKREYDRACTKSRPGEFANNRFSHQRDRFSRTVMGAIKQAGLKAAYFKKDKNEIVLGDAGQGFYEEVSGLMEHYLTKDKYDLLLPLYLEFEKYMGRNRGKVKRAWGTVKFERGLIVLTNFPKKKEREKKNRIWNR